MTTSQPVHRRRPTTRGFTLIEVLVVIGIIVVLIGILIPVVSRVRTQAQVANVSAQIAGLAGAIERYQADFKAYPGAFTNAQHGATAAPMVPTITIAASASGAGYDTATITPADVTMSEALVLAMCGGLTNTGTRAEPDFVYDPAQVGSGPNSLNPDSPKRYTPYLEPKDLSWRDGPNGRTGKYEDGAGEASDTIIPELVDRFANPMPILYVRANVGGAGATAPPAEDNNPIITDVATGAIGQYQLRHLLPYTTADGNGRFIGEGKRVDVGDFVPSLSDQSNIRHGLADVDVNAKLDKGDSAYEYPYNAYPYFSHPTLQNTARAKDTFILISAGLDRVYGTEDDITSFGSVLP